MSSVVYAADYQKPPYTVEKTRLLFRLDPVCTSVVAEYLIVRQDASASTLVLDGEALRLQSVARDGVFLGAGEYQVDSQKLTIPCDQDRALIRVEVEISPEQNTHLQGLYTSQHSLCTQCEAQGFRRIVYSIDRPDVLSVYDVGVVYDINQYPKVIVAGEKVEERLLTSKHALVRFIDEHPKPTYLFALVAGYFATLSDRFITKDGRKVGLHIHLPIQYAIGQVEFALSALKRAMHWDEHTFNCIYDLPVYHIVGFADFNFGAMENKGLNIFNTSLLLAEPDITVDSGHLNVLSVVGHEYFHNWTGNRVGCANWFQLSLKEGLTTYREMRFACDSYGEIARLGYIQSLVEDQFREDRGPTAHAVIPESYEKIDNFYTSTIYTKGSEILRMLEDIIGRACLDKAVQRYLQTYDGQAVTINEFLSVISEVGQVSLDRFDRWYRQVGTPLVEVDVSHDCASQTLTVRFVQSASRGKAADAYEALLMPIRLRLWSEQGQLIRPSGVADVATDGSWVTCLSEKEKIITIKGIAQKPIVASFLRLSAPVCHRDSLTITEKIKLITFECDPYIKQNAAQECWRYLLSQEAPSLSAELEEGLNQVLSGWMDAPELLPLVFGVPGLRSCQEGAVLFDFDGLLQKHQQLVLLLATRWEKVWAEILQGSLFQLRGVYKWDKRCVALRRAQALALKMLMQCNASKYMEQAVQIFESADNLTARCAVLDAVLPIATAPRAQLLKKMHKMADGHDLLMNKCLYYEAYQHQDSLEGIAALFTDARCDRKRPNSVMAWFSGWMHGHYEKLHQKDGRGYVVLKEAIKAIDTINPFTATRLVGPLLQYQYFDSARQEKMKLALKWLSHQNPSKNLNEKLTMVMQSVTA